MRSILTAAALLLSTPAVADPMLADFPYPHEVRRHTFTAQGQQLGMAYMDVAPATSSNGRTVVLLHGKNFCGATWEGQIGVLASAGYRVIVPDQIGFCKSDKPDRYQFGIHELAANTRGLLTRLGIENPILVGHSMGGMLAMRYALSFPRETGAIVLVNPIGLEDWRAKGVPELTLDQLYEAERKTDAERIKTYQLKAYYGGVWKSEYDRWVNMLATMYEGSGGLEVAWMQALASRAIFSDPVVHELERIRVPTGLLIGEQDRTAIGRDRASPEIASTLGNYAVLARETARRIPGARLVTFASLGHSPHVQAPEAFNATLLSMLDEVRQP